MVLRYRFQVIKKNWTSKTALIWTSKSWNRFHLNFELDFKQSMESYFDSRNRFHMIPMTWRILKQIADDTPNRFEIDFRLFQSISSVPWNHYKGLCESMSDDFSVFQRSTSTSTSTSTSLSLSPSLPPSASRSQSHYIRPFGVDFQETLESDLRCSWKL